MHTYQYQPGDTPLAGYTIKSAAGHGGFGEVYYAVSDSGREVALKAVQGYEQIELRGIRQCMNLKSPHLVTIFDVRNNEKGQPFVLMEYVTGPSLADLIDDSPNGLGAEKTAFFLREIAKGLSYLHDCGIVHRDLKPANIFYENGYVKIGDYGLSKAISAEQNHSQTVTVGTVHYMAPEVGAGRYDRSIDIYAMGVVVYEMLTGRVPFKGDTPSEILMKHLSATPELDEIEEPFRAVIRKAMVKDPAERYQSVNAMVEDVFGQERMKQSMASFSTADLSMVAGQVAKKVRVGADSASPSEHYDTGNTYKDSSDPGEPSALYQAGYVSGRVMQDRGLGVRAHADALRDPMKPGQRRVLALIALGVVALGTGLIAGSAPMEERNFMLFAMTASLGAVLGLVVAHRRLVPTLAHESNTLRRVIVGGLATLVAGVLSFMVVTMMTGDWQDSKTSSLIALAVPLLLINWAKAMSPGRSDRISFGAAAGAGALGFLGSLFVSDIGAVFAIGVSAAVMLAVQALSPFDPTTDEDGDGYDPYRGPAHGPGQHPHKERIQRAQAAAHRPTPNPKPATHRTERVNAYSAVVTANHSTRSRTAALVFALLPFVTGVPLFGLQRFYAGKTGTGILWLLTFGFCGIGQIVDIVLIGTGAFDDGHGRPVSAWNVGNRRADEPSTRPGTSPQTQAKTAAGPRLPGLIQTMHSLVASVLILMGLVLSLGLATHLPYAIESGAIFPGMSADMTNAFGFNRWPSMMMDFGQVLAGGLLITGGVVLMFARRKQGALHVIRAAVPTLTMALFVPIVSPKLARYTMSDRWYGIVEEINLGRPGPAIELFTHSFDWPAAVFLGLIVLGSVFTLAWPADPKDAVTAKPVEEGA